MLCKVERGPTATLDMKLRVRALRADGADLIDALWSRYTVAVTGDGFRYEHAEQRQREAELV